MTGKPARGLRKLVRGLRRTASRGGGGREGGRGSRAAATPAAWPARDVTALVRAVLGPRAIPPDTDADPALAAGATRLAARQRAQAEFAAAIAAGEDLERAVPRCVSELARAGAWDAAWSVAQGAARLPGGGVAGALATAVLLHRQGDLARAWTRIRDLDDATLRRVIPVEAIDAALGGGAADGRQRARSIGVPDAALGPTALLDLAGRLLAVGERDAAAAMIAELRGRTAAGQLDPWRRHSLELVERSLRAPRVAVPAGAVPLGIIDYGTPDHRLRSGNVGDYIQTLALLGNLARLVDVEIGGEAGLDEIVASLRARVPSALRVHGPAGRVHLLPVDRDSSSLAEIPDGTWLLAFGWHMHPLFGLRTDFPYHPAIRPLFVSFHVNQLGMLDDAGIAYLRQYGPVGCRDWTTVYLLLAAGVDAFFTGCLTTTVDAVFPTREAVHRPTGLVGAIDVAPSATGAPAPRVRTFAHQSESSREAAIAQGIRDADRLLAGYQCDLDSAVTSRLHAYLPMTTLGVPVTFRPRFPGDVRFAGLDAMTVGDPRLRSMRTGIRELLAAALVPVVAGEPEAVVYARWRELTREAVAEARRRFAAEVADPPVDPAVARATASLRADPGGVTDPGGETYLAVGVEPAGLLPAAVLLASAAAATSGSLRAWILGRGLERRHLDWLAEAVPGLSLSHVACDAVRWPAVPGPSRKSARGEPPASLDRLLLPAALPGVDRVVWLDPDTLVLGDLAALARMELGGHVLAAADAPRRAVDEWRQAGRRLAAADALELRRRMGLRHGISGPALDGGVLVLDLARMRAEGTGDRAIALAGAYGLDAAQALLAAVGPARAVLAPAWNARPSLADIEEPLVLHWTDLGAPWEPGLTPGRDTWAAIAAGVHGRAGDPPAG